MKVPPIDIVQSLDSFVVNLNNMEGNNEVKGEGFTLQVYEADKEQENTNSSSVDLSGCESVLRLEYNIDPSVPLLVAKMEMERENAVVNQIGYEIYPMSNLNENKINIII